MNISLKDRVILNEIITIIAGDANLQKQFEPDVSNTLDECEFEKIDFDSWLGSLDLGVKL